MNDRELRIALVLYGGLSLAVYMHGVTKEIQKLVRASKVLQRARRAGSDTTTGYDAFNDESERETDTERGWFKLLETLGKGVNLRVVVDVISGTSAGGINGIMLGRALAHDLPLDNHRGMWLDGADVTALMDRDALPTRWSKAYVRPFLWGLRRAAGHLPDDMLDKLGLLIRSRWWNPPFSGPAFYDKLLDAMYAMGPAGHEHSLLPFGHPLSLYVTLTELHGRPHTLKLHSPREILERTHQMCAVFEYLERPGGARSDFDDAAIPGLAFAARATSSYAGLFAPMTLREAMDVTSNRGAPWPHLEEFSRAQLERDAHDSMHWPYVDGGVLNNKPFETAIDAIRSRHADREVVRRLLYVEPNPELATPEVAPTLSYFGLIKRTMVDLPQAEPIGADVTRLSEANSRVRRIARLVAGARPRVNALVEDKLGLAQSSWPEPETVAAFRVTADRHAVDDSGYVSSAYLDSRWTNWLQSWQQTVRDEDSWFSSRVQDWLSTQADAERLQWRLSTFDDAFRMRRLGFVLRRLNELYRHGSGHRSSNTALGRLKAALHREREFAQSTLPTLASAAAKHPGDRQWCEETARLIGGIDERLDTQIAALGASGLHLDLAWDLLLAYLGFGFFDVLTWSQQGAAGFRELVEVKVVRVSPADADAIRKGDAETTLKSIQFGNFAGFFSRAYRENDYLWGRLQACDRLVDVILDAAAEAGTDIDPITIKRTLFEQVLASEAAFLPLASAEIRRIEAEIGQLG
ncbi:MAG: patatin-like protein [Pseudomonadota bacterium]